MLSNTQDSIIINTEKIFKISTNRFNRYDGQMNSCRSEKIYRNLGCGTSLVQYFGRLKFSEKKDVGPATQAYINGYKNVNVQKSLETVTTQ